MTIDDRAHEGRNVGCPTPAEWAAWRAMVGDDLMGGYAKVVYPRGSHRPDHGPDRPHEEP